MTSATVLALEVEQLHQFFQDWFSGALANTDETFARLKASMHDDFSIVSPNASEKDRATLLDVIRGAHGSRTELRIWVSGFRLLHQEGPLSLIRYEEWQQDDGKQKRRVSTALLRDAERAPNGVQWMSVHETWVV